MRKIGLKDWHEWRMSFLTAFVDKDWSKIRTAYNFKYLGGSLIDYALTKEKLCLEAEGQGTALSSINMIVVGLPLEVQDKLDREEITGIDKLFIELRKLDDSYNSRRKEYSATLQLAVKEKTDKPKDQKKHFTCKHKIYNSEAAQLH